MVKLTLEMASLKFLHTPRIFWISEFVTSLMNLRVDRVEETSEVNSDFTVGSGKSKNIYVHIKFVKIGLRLSVEITDEILYIYIYAAVLKKKNKKKIREGWLGSNPGPQGESGPP